MYSIKLMPYVIVRMSWACSFNEDGIRVFTAKTGKNVLGKRTRDGKIIPCYLKLRKHIFSHFSGLKIRVHLKFDYYF